MELTLLDGDATTIRAGYDCPCGCTPSVAYTRGAELANEGCCCGNQFAVGPRAARSLTPRVGFRAELQTFDAPWGERLEAAWLVGPSVHAPAVDHGHDHEHGEDHDGAATPARAIDPVCGMAVELATARMMGLHSTHSDVDRYFCGKGCKLEFDEDPDHYLDPGYVPSM